MEIELRQLRALRAVIEHGSFNRAAIALGLTQPAISKSINLLERACGATLFERGRGGAVLTPAGRVIARTAANADHLIRQAKLELNIANRGGSGPLIIGATPSANLGMVPRACAKLTDQLGLVDITIREGLDAELLPALENGEINILVGPVSDLHVSPPHFHEETLLEERFLVGMAPGNRLARHRTLHLKELADAPWVLPSEGSRFYQLVEAMFLNEAIAWPQDKIVTNTLLAQELIVMATNRVLLLTEVQLIARRTELVVIPLAKSPIRRFGWRTLRSAANAPLVSSFVDLLSQIVRDGQ